MSDSPSDRVGYLELIRSNADFRRIWIGEVASWLGDWFNAIALYTLIQRLTGSPLALGLVFITKMLPFAAVSPFAGLLVDRFDRRRLMIAADLLRAAIVLGFLLVDEPGEVWLLYALSAAQMMISAVFIPARSASLPNITTPGELLTANALSAATWSTILAVGAALGGVATEWLGVRTVFVLDSASYLISALFIFRAVIPQSTDKLAGPATVASALGDIAAGWRHMRAHPPVARIALTKAAWATGGGGLVYMLALLGEGLLAGAPAAGIGLLYSVRGLGTGLGPVAVRAFLPEESRWPVMLGVGIVVTGLAYGAVGALPWAVWIVAPLVLLAHTPSGANWVASTVLLQKRTEDRFRGRVFASEWLLLTLTDALSILAASLLLESGLLTLRGGILTFAAVQIASGLAWLALIAPRERAASAEIAGG